MSCYIAAWSIEREVERIASEHPALWREIRRFNLPVKLALAAAQRVLPALESARTARLVGLAPCRPGSPELRAISRDLDAGFAKGSTEKLRVNPIYTLHAIDNLGLSALSIRLENREPVSCLGGAAGQAWAGLEEAFDLLTGAWPSSSSSSSSSSPSSPSASSSYSPSASSAASSVTAPTEVLMFGGDQSDASWKGEGPDAEGCGAAVVLTSKPQRIRIVSIDRADRGPIASTSGSASASGSIAAIEDLRPHAARGLAAWFHALASSPVGQYTYKVPGVDGDGIDRISITTEILPTEASP